ncbi:MAG TPA: VanZ family protein [Candidatus Omnitrophota bacterium]|nr:VanZ family protein [Candidatus Omnitrophota bacterium]
MTVGWAGMVTFLSLCPSETFQNIQTPFYGEDKLVHFVMYMVFSLLLIRAFLVSRAWKKDKIRIFLFTAVFTIGYSIVMEIAQGFLATRVASFGDIAANAAGVVASILLVREAKEWLK